MAEVSQNTKYVKLDDGVSFSLVRTNPKLTTNTKLMYNGKKMYMESYASGELLNRTQYKNVSVKSNSTYNKDIANFLTGSGTQAYTVYQNFSDVTISSSYDNQFETMYWCGAEYIDSSFYTEEIGFVAPLYLREKLPNYFLIFRLDTPSNYNLNIDENGNILDSTFDFKKDILDKAVLIKTFDLREESESPLGKYIRNYINQEEFEFDKSMYVNFSNGEVTYYGINKADGVLVKRVDNFNNELLKTDNPVLKNDKWFTDGFERNNLIFPYIINIEYLFDDDYFKNENGEKYDFARYIGLYCNTIEFGEFSDLNEFEVTEDNTIYYFKDNKNNLHRYIKKIKDSIYDNDIDYYGGDSDNVNISTEYEVKIDGKDIELFDKNLISGFEKERVTGYAEPLNIYEGFINRAQYGFEILKPFEPGDWVGIEYIENDENGNNIIHHVERYFADNQNLKIGEYDGFRFSVSENSTVNDITNALVKCVNNNKKSKFEARCSDNVVVFYAKKEGEKYNGTKYSGSKILLEESLVYNRKISLPISNTLQHINDINITSDSGIPNSEDSLFGDYYVDYFCGACTVDINQTTDVYKNIFKIYSEESVFFSIDRYLKTNNGEGRRICTNMQYIDAEGNIDSEYRLVIVDDAPKDKYGDIGYDVSVSSTYQVEILDLFKPNHGVLSWFPVKDFDFDINYSSYGQYGAFVDECNKMSKKISYKQFYNINDTSDLDTYSTQESSTYGIKELAKSPFYDDYGNSLESEYGYYLEQFHPDLCLLSKTTPYILKWGYYDEQKDSCENPYRLNVSKVFGVSNLSANSHLIRCDETEYTHSMPYYMTLNIPDYKKEYQYISSGVEYIENSNVNNQIVEYGESVKFEKTSDCVEYWTKMFMKTDKDMFSYFFSGKKYGKRFDRKYSRLLGGDKFNNPSTLFRGVKFEVVRQYSGMEKRSEEYNDYKFSFIYIPIVINSITFNQTIYFIKNDTFKFIVGIIFVNTMLGNFEHNIFGGNIDYFNKAFLYSGCKDIIFAESNNHYMFDLEVKNLYGSVENVENVNSDFLHKNYVISEKINKFYMWIDEQVDEYDKKTVFITNTSNVTKKSDIIGEFYISDSSDSDSDSDIDKSIGKVIEKYINIIGNLNEKEFKYNNSIEESVEHEQFKILYNRYFEKYDTTIYGYKIFKYYGEVDYKIVSTELKFDNNKITEICDIVWEYNSKIHNTGYNVNVSNLQLKESSLRNILINIGAGNDSIFKIKFHKKGNEEIKTFINKNYEEYYNDKYNDKNNNSDSNKFFVGISVDNFGNIKINESKRTEINVDGDNEFIEDLLVDIIVMDRFDNSCESIGLKDYFSLFNQLSMYNIKYSINNDNNIKYYSTIEGNKYKIRVVEPDSIEIDDMYEAIPVKISQNNKSVVGSVDIKKKIDVDKIGIKVINRYSGFYNPIFNDILYYGDYSYNKTIGELNDNFELPYSNTFIDYSYDDDYGKFGVIKNMYYHKTNINVSDKILKSTTPVYPAINEYALGYRDYNIFSSSWDDGYFMTQDDLDNSSRCSGIGSMKEGLCMFGSKYFNLPDYIFIDTFKNGKPFDEKSTFDIGEDIDSEFLYKEIDNRTVRYYLYIEKILKRELKDKLIKVFEKYINTNYSLGNKGTIEDDVEEYIEKNLLKLYKVDKVSMYVKSDIMKINNKRIENEYLKYMNKDNESKFNNGFQGIKDGDKIVLKDSKFTMSKTGTNEFDRIITYNLKPGFKESFGFSVSFKRK